MDMPSYREFDYTIMFWFRSLKSLSDLQDDDSILNKKAYLFELPGSTACYVSRTEEEESAYIACSTPGDNLKMKLADLPDLKSWMHFTYSANFVPVSGLAPVESTAYISVNGITVTGEYSPMQDRNIYYGCG
jgi:hypothetical protein